MNITFAKQPLNGPVPNAMAMAALEQAQWSISARRTVPSINETSKAALPLVPVRKKVVKEWPTPFENGGANYILDATTGLYLEDDSGFTYDMTMKLYYSKKAEKYYKHTSETIPPFTECTPSSSEAQSTLPAEAEVVVPRSKKKAKNAITFGKVDGSVSSRAPASVKKVADEIAKWSTAAIDIFDESSELKPITVSNVKEKNAAAVSTHVAAGSLAVAGPALIAGPDAVASSVSAAPVCLVGSLLFHLFFILKMF